MKNYIVEFIGTFFLVFVIGLCVIEPGGAGAMAPLAIGSILMVMVYAGGPISGAHYNPAVTFGIWLRGKYAGKDVFPYIISQLLGAFLAAFLVGILKSGAVITAATPDPVHALIAEFIFTFALVFVVLNVATAKKSEGNSYFGLAIGFTVMASAYAVGSISGGVFNPAVAIGITLMGLSKLGNLWIFLVANFAAGATAAGVFKLVNPEE